MGCSERIALKQVYYHGWNRSPAQAGCMRQVLRAGALGRPRGMGWGGRQEGGSGWGAHVDPWLIHVNVWQKPLQYCKVISLQLIKINEKQSKQTNKKDEEALYSQQKKTRSDFGSDHELLLGKFRLKLKKVGKTTKPFRYDLNHFPYDYTVEVRNISKGLDLIECLMNYGQRFMTLYRRQGSRLSPRKRNTKKQNGCLRRPYN